MTDSELIKALENKVHGSDYACFEDYEILALIKRQQTEIKKLEKARQKQAELLSELRAQKYELMNRMPLVKNEAYKEFAEKLKESIKENVDEAWHSDDGNGIYDAEYVFDDIDSLLQELAGENK